MSAPATSDPVAVTTADGTSWVRRAVTRDGRGLYAVDGSCQCPEFLLVPLSELAVHGIRGMADALPMPVPVGPEPQASGGYPPALPWARLMDDEDLADFLDELAASAITHASNARALAEVEDTIARWRLIGEAQHGHNTAPGPDAMTQAFAPAQALREDEPPLRGRALLDALTVERAERTHNRRLGIEDPHDSPLHHDYRVGRDLPELGGSQ